MDAHALEIRPSSVPLATMRTAMRTRRQQTIEPEDTVADAAEPAMTEPETSEAAGPDAEEVMVTDAVGFAEPEETLPWMTCRILMCRSRRKSRRIWHMPKTMPLSTKLPSEPPWPEPPTRFRPLSPSHRG